MSDNVATDDTQIVINALQLIKRHEGFSEFPVPDSKNTVSIGYGSNLSLRGITKTEAELLAHRDVMDDHVELLKHPWYVKLNTARPIAILDVAYATGLGGLLGFHDMIAALLADEYDAAASDLLRSEFARVDRMRALEDARILWEGVITEPQMRALVTQIDGDKAGSK